MPTSQLRKVIYVDDSSDEIFLTNILFQKQNIELDVVHCVDYPSFEHAIDQADKDDICSKFIVVDLNFPTLKGTDLISMMVADSRSKNWIMGICTGSDDPADKRNAFSAGAQFCVSKPLDASSLKAICDQVSRLSLRESKRGKLQLVDDA